MEEQLLLARPRVKGAGARCFATNPDQPSPTPTPPPPSPSPWLGEEATSVCYDIATHHQVDDQTGSAVALCSALLCLASPPPCPLHPSHSQYSNRRAGQRKHSDSSTLPSFYSRLSGLALAENCAPPLRLCVCACVSVSLSSPPRIYNSSRLPPPRVNNPQSRANILQTVYCRAPRQMRHTNKDRPLRSRTILSI